MHTCPCLWISGIAHGSACNQAEAPLRADDYLPSVMTCASYLKLPVWSLLRRHVMPLARALASCRHRFLLASVRPRPSALLLQDLTVQWVQIIHLDAMWSSMNARTHTHNALTFPP